MSYLTGHWSFDPFLIIAIVLVGWHEIGLARLARRSRPERTRERRLRSLWFYGGLGMLPLPVEAPVPYWAGDHFSLPMCHHPRPRFPPPPPTAPPAPRP